MKAATASPHENFQQWLADINLLCGEFEGEALGSDFAGTISGHQYGALRFSQVDSRCARLVRTPREVKRSEVHKYFAVFQVEGTARMAQESLREVIEPGDVILIDSARPSQFEFGHGSRQVSLILPHDRVHQLMRFAPLDICRKIPAQSPVARLAQQMLLSSTQLESVSLAESEAVIDALVSLMRPALSGSDNNPDPHERILRKALQLIETNIADENLCPEMIARDIGVSMRGLYRVFAKNGLVVAQYIKNRRLDICAEVLRSPQSNLKLSALGFAWGFSNSSYFTTAFKQRFGLSPGEYRKRYA
ncbi:transcriptional regulator FeaR [Pseudomonas capeferrum]|uniref:transcriptional regulator FeaR n=1 Tax=Pseudomonas capeferrum TaxID=1495066 RepID=UPI0015E30508|nr:transcriptional regulator FeaR [Pseudomonas capeferrum]MBA1203227.1 transcriptional regulator FeaR [Pseudomonas capeferrum]